MNTAYACMCTRYVYIYMYIRMHAYVCIYIYIYIYVYAYVCTYAYMCRCIYGSFYFVRLPGFPPQYWGVLCKMAPRLPKMPCSGLGGLNDRLFATV